MDKKSTYTQPVIFNAKMNPKATWRIIWYEMTEPGKWKRARPTGDLNRIKSPTDRLIAANVLCKMISEALAKGWRYFQNKKADTYQNTSLITALESHAKSKAATLSTVKSGRSFISWTNVFVSFLRTEGLSHLSIYDLSPVHVQLFVDHCNAKGKSNTTINNIVSGVGVIFTRIKRLYNLPLNPFQLVDKLKRTESTRFEIITDEELVRINNHLKKVCPALRLFFLHEYYAYLRPATIVQFQAKHYNFTDNSITVNPTAHKNRKANTKQMLKPLRDALIEYGVHELPPDTYIFSAKMKPGSELRSPSRAGKLWKKHVNVELGIDKRLYAGKHTGATNFINDNPNGDIHWFQKQMGHSNLAESAAYIKSKKVLKLDETSTKIRKL